VDIALITRLDGGADAEPSTRSPNRACVFIRTYYAEARCTAGVRANFITGQLPIRSPGIPRRPCRSGGAIVCRPMRYHLEGFAIDGLGPTPAFGARITTHLPSAPSHRKRFLFLPTVPNVHGFRISFEPNFSVYLYHLMR